jgi:protoheme IX farnesyltransferase
VSFSSRYRALVYGSLVASFLVVVWGGIVRVTGSGLGCPDWPLCHGQFLPSLDPATRIEWTHRFLAIASGLTVAAIVVSTLVAYRADRRVLTLALIAAVLYPMQAVLGGITVVLELPPEWVTLHLANAELLLATLTVLTVVVRWPSLRPAGASSWTWLAIAAAVGMFVLLVSGAYVRGADATAACPAWPLCGQIVPNPTPREFRIDFPWTGAPAIAMLHRYIAAGVGIVVIAACVEAWRHRRDAPGLGPLGFSPWALGAHPAVASLLWCSVVALAAVASRSVSGQRQLVRDLITLTKPAIMSLLLVTALGGMFLAQGGVPPFGILAATLIGGAAASGGASSLNHYFDRDLDERMRRTRKRPLPAHRISGRLAVVWGIALNVLAFAVLAAFTNLLAASLAIAGTVFYILVYTLWLKRTTVQNVVIGGAAGAIPPLVGWAAITGSLDLAAWLLFAIVFFWTPAHFWALALLIRDDYERAGVPMMPVILGDEATAWNILAYAASLLPLSLRLFVAAGLGYVYLAAAIVLGAIFIAYAFRLLRGGALRRRVLARAVYLYSLVYLALLFVAIMVDSTLRL